MTARETALPRTAPARAGRAGGVSVPVVLAGEGLPLCFPSQYRPESPRGGNPILNPRTGSAGVQVR